ncbi:hypothetical protein CCHR01_02266 [Colletotrichum chrysophilum]|uniref:Uncharacterized protein n=1 Tax=Colletotrichum chrysophilum TaxID=1836956 RepID=A0AAD9AV27_9PEZI|nr:hypothetical protein CCHR01_02266 [Colletotrichum chrysophilum]
MRYASKTCGDTGGKRRGGRKVAVSGWIVEGREGEVGEEEKEMGLESQTNRDVLVGFGDLGSGRKEEAEEEEEEDEEDEEEEDGKEIRYWTSTA